jgi:hypothetical protein
VLTGLVWLRKPLHRAVFFLFFFFLMMPWIFYAIFKGNGEEQMK